MHIQELDKVVRSRAQRLERQSAIYGLSTPPEISIQIEDYRKVRITIHTLIKQYAEHGGIDMDLFNRLINTLSGLGISLTSIEFGEYKDNRL